MALDPKLVDRILALAEPQFAQLSRGSLADVLRRELLSERATIAQILITSTIDALHGDAPVRLPKTKTAMEPETTEASVTPVLSAAIVQLAQQHGKISRRMVEDLEIADNPQQVRWALRIMVRRGDLVPHESGKRTYYTLSEES